jgi:hypothetical protein
MNKIIKLKTLKQIQKENRRFILEATLEGNNLRLLKENIGDFSGAKLNLARLILAIPSELCYYKVNNLLFIAKLNEEPKQHINLDLTKETLEEQNEYTQRDINKLLTTKHYGK